MARAQVGLRLDRDLLEWVDAARGDVPRNRWIERLIESQRLTDEINAEPEEAERLRGARQQSRDGKLKSRAELDAELAAVPLPKVARRYWA